MAKRKAKPAPAPNPQIEVDSVPDSLPIDEPEAPPRPRFINRRQVLAVIVGLAMLAGFLLVGFEKIYSGKVVPGVSAAGVYLGGLNREEALKKVENRIQTFIGESIQLRYGDSVLTIPITGLDYTYDATRAVEVALNYGREGSWFYQTRARLRAMFSRSTNVAVYDYNEQKLAGYLTIISNQVNEPVQNAALRFAGGEVVVRHGRVGKRADGGAITQAIEERLAKSSSRPIEVSIYDQGPPVNRAALEDAKHQADTFLQSPLTLQNSGTSYKIGIPQIISWIKIVPVHKPNLMKIPELEDYGPRLTTTVNLELNRDLIRAYVARIARQIDQPGQDAALTIRDGRAVVFKPSRDGITLDQGDAVQAIVKELSQPATERTVALKVRVTKPKVREESLNDLGINELISEGYSTFPGSDAGRIQNIHTASARYNGSLIKPGETFSFGENLGEVGPHTGYAPATVIVGKRLEQQYGGGICQVSSTMYRAALLAGLPIVARTNHSFAVSYYTAPYGVPGVDATIWMPGVDLKFTNDTGHHILVQTVISGITLKFQFYGTKVKEGRIRGPFFIKGSLDSTKPSQTVFYRDVLVNGKVKKTDSIYTYYQASSEFSKPQFN